MVDYEDFYKYDESSENIDVIIQELMRRLQITKEERKQAQNRISIVEHRLALLKDQEKLVFNDYSGDEKTRRS